MLNLVEKKNIYTIYLVNILTPLIFEGIQSIYIEASNISNDDNVLKIFQTFLKRIPKWNRELIEKETSRIINATQTYDWLNDLIKATVKANLAIMLYDHNVNLQSNINPELYQNINITDFIHKIYCECARDIWNNPDLFYHNYPPLEIKRNQRESLVTIKECIREAIRQLIPVRHILKIYLGEDIKFNKANDNFEKPLTEEDENYLPKMLKKDLDDKQLALSYHGSDLDNITKDKRESAKHTSDQTIGTKILKILDQPEIPNPSETSVNNILDSDENSEDVFKSFNKPTKTQMDNNSLTIDDKIRKVLYNNKSIPTKTRGIQEHAIIGNKSLDKRHNPELDNGDKLEHNKYDSDIHTSLNYTLEDTNKYQEIFSNYNMVQDKKSETPVNQDKKFFNKYMQF
jgi:hypothetical protein